MYFRNLLRAKIRLFSLCRNGSAPKGDGRQQTFTFFNGIISFQGKERGKERVKKSCMNMWQTVGPNEAMQHEPEESFYRA